MCDRKNKGKKNSKAWLDFIVPIKFTTTRRPGGVGVGVGCRGWKEERKEKKSKRNHRTSGNKRINVPLESLLSDSFPLPGSHSLPHLPRMPSNTVLVSGPAVGAAQILIWSYSCVFLPPMSTASELVRFLWWLLSMSFYIFHRHSLPSWSCGFNLQLVQLVGRFWVFILCHTASGLQLWFYFHLCTGVVHWGLLQRLPWRAWVCPCEGQVWRWCSCLGHRGPGSTRYSGVLAARAAGNTVL